MRFVADLSLAMLILLDPYIYIYVYTYVCNSRLCDQYTRKCLGFLIEEGIGGNCKGWDGIGGIASKFVRFSNFSKIENFLKLCLVSIKRSPRDFLILL